VHSSNANTDAIDATELVVGVVSNIDFLNKKAPSMKCSSFVLQSADKPSAHDATVARCGSSGALFALPSVGRMGLAIAVVALAFAVPCGCLAATWLHPAFGQYRSPQSWAPSIVPDQNTDVYFGSMKETTVADETVLFITGEEAARYAYVVSGNYTFQFANTEVFGEDGPPYLTYRTRSLTIGSAVREETLADTATLTVNIDPLGHPGRIETTSLDIGPPIHAGETARPGTLILDGPEVTLELPAATLDDPYDRGREVVVGGGGNSGRLEVRNGARFITPPELVTYDDGIYRSYPSYVGLGGQADFGSGSPQSGHGEMLVTGVGSLVDANGGLWLASDGTATAEVRDGGRIRTPWIDFGSNRSEGIGRLIVAGAGKDEYQQPISSHVRTRRVTFYEPQSVIEVRGEASMLIAADDVTNVYLPVGSVYLHRTGAFYGSGSIIGRFIIGRGATYSPGRSPGMLTVDGDFEIEEEGTLQLEIGGSTPQTGYDQLVVTGDTVLRGTINVSLINGFDPKPGDVFDLLDVGGDFNYDQVQFRFTNAPAGVQFQNLLSENGIRLAVVPEPSTIAYTGIPLLLVVSVLRRRQPRERSHASSRVLIVATTFLPMLGMSEWVVASDLVRTVSLTGQPAPGIDGTFSDFRGKVWDELPVALNERGHVAFYAEVSGAAIVEDNDSGLWSEGGGNGLAIVAREGSLVMGAPTPFGDFTTGFYSDLALSRQGDIAFRHEGLISTGNSIEPGGANGLFYADHAGTVGTIAYRGGPAAIEDKVFADIDIRSITVNQPPAASPILNEAGNAAFVGILSPGNGVTDDNRWGIWRYNRQGGLQLFIRAGVPAPGATESIWFFEPDIAINNQNEVAFRGRPGEFQQGPGSGIWVANANAELRQVARTGESAPGTATTFNYLSAPAFNSGGHVAFFAVLNPDTAQASYGSGVWRETAANSLQLVARSGDAAPGTQAFFSFVNSESELPGLNDSGEMAFVSDLSGPEVSELNDTGIWKVNANGSLALVAREGDAAPGTAGVFAPYGLGGAFINGAGQVAFYGGISDGGLNPTNNFGIWAQSLDGEVHLIAHTGGYLDVSDTPGVTDLRQIAVLYSPLAFGNGNGRPSAFNDRGQIAFMAAFTDGTSGVFVSHVVAIPEPASVSILSVAAFSMLGIFRHTGTATP